MSDSPFVLSLGSNLGDRAATLQAAVDALQATPGIRVTRVSRVYETDPVEVTDQPDFLNLVVVGRTTLEPEALLARGLSIEDAAGRVRRRRKGPRTLDVDVLWIEGVTVDEPDLEVPHPRMWERAFVLVPLAEIASQCVSAEQLQAVADQGIERSQSQGWWQK